MKHINHYPRKGNEKLHIETVGCVVNITVGLEDFHGNRVTSVEVLPDPPELGHSWQLVGYSNTRVIRVPEGGRF